MAPQKGTAELLSSPSDNSKESKSIGFSPINEIKSVYTNEAPTNIKQLNVLKIQDISKTTSSDFDVSVARGHVSISKVTYPMVGSKYNKFQIDFNFQLGDVYSPLSPTNPNVFDPDIIDISAVFTLDGDSGLNKKRVNAFYMVDFNRNSAAPNVTGYVDGQPLNINPIDQVPASGGLKPKERAETEYLTRKYASGYPIGYQWDPTPWHVRFAPPKIGQWSFTFIVIVGGDTANPIYIPGGSFKVIDSNNKGYIKASQRNFRFGTNEIFFPIGVHANWNGWRNYNRILYLHAKFIINEIAKNKGNHCRMFLTHDKFGIEHETLNDYSTATRQERAYDLDDIIEFAQSKGVYLQLVLDERIEFNIDETIDPIVKWSMNPYYTINSDNKKFWTNKKSKRHYRNKLRYILARWGYSTNIFAFEFMNEISMAVNYFWWVGENTTGRNDYPELNPDGDPGAKFVSNWINEMIYFCKNTLGNDHMYTVSLGNRDSEAPVNDKDFVNSANIDFYTDHFYSYSEFQDHFINYLANRARYRYPNKPYILGEFGYGDVKGGSCAVYADQPPGFTSTIYAVADYHNALFASVLSGSSGAITSWNDFTNTSWGGQLQYILSLVKFLQGEDLNLANIVAIRNQCCDDEKVCIPNHVTDFLVEGLPLKIFNSDIVANNSKVEAFAFKYIHGDSMHKIIGWVRNCNNWWFNLPHHDKNVVGSPCYNPNPVVNPLTGITLTIKGILCNARYRIDFWSVYPKWPLYPGGIQEDGGKIEFNTYYADSDCGKLTFSVPELLVLKPGNAPYAPDYGFKITPISKGWGHGFIGSNIPSASGIQPMAITGDGTQIAFRGNDGSLQCYYRSNANVYSWTHVVLGSTGYRGVKEFGSICRGATSGQIYYHGADDRLQCIYWDVTHWAHTHLTDWSNTSQNVGGDIGSNSVGGKIFYRGADGQLHFYLFSGGWHHSIHYLGIGKRPAADTNFAVSADGNFVAFKGNDGTLVFVWYDAVSGTYQNDYRTSEKVDGTIRMTSAGNVLFYRGQDGKLHQVYYEGSGWHSRIITTTWGEVSFVGSFDIQHDSTKDNAKIFFRGPEGFIHVVFVWDDSWIQGPILDCGTEPAYRKCRKGGYVLCADKMVMYQSVIPSEHGLVIPEVKDKNIQAYYYGKCDTKDGQYYL